AAGSVGNVSVIARGNAGWHVVDTLAPSGLAARAAFGMSMALDGSTLAVGAPGAHTVVMFERRGGEWTEAQRITPPARIAGFGGAVALRGDELVIGAGSSGAAFRYQRRD